MEYASVPQGEGTDMKQAFRKAPGGESFFSRALNHRWALLSSLLLSASALLLSLSIYTNNRTLTEDRYQEIYAQVREQNLAKTRANIIWDESALGRDTRYASLSQKGATLWMTGLSGSGKSTLGKALEELLVTHDHVHVYRLDGDNIRTGLNRDLGFSASDRAESVRRVGEVSALMSDSGTITIVSLVSPYRKDRDLVRALHERMGVPFIEVFMDVPLSVVMDRDPKGLYKKVKEGKIKGFTGVDSPYEAPLKPEVRLVPDDKGKIPQMVRALRHELVKRGVLLPGGTPEGYPALSPADGLMAEREKDSSSASSSPVGASSFSYFTGKESREREEKLRREAETLPKILITDIDVQWAQVLGEGWAAPLRGFMREGTLLQTLHFNSILVDPYNLTGNQQLHTEKTDFDNYNTAIQRGERVSSPIPIVLAINDMQKELAAGAGAVALVSPSGRTIAILRDPEVYSHRKEEIIARAFGGHDPGHPYIKIVNQAGDWLLGGEIELVGRVRYNDGLDAFRLTPTELRERFISLHADAVVAFQTRNPTHAGHAYLMKTAIKQLQAKGYQNPVLWLSPLGGWTKDDDVPLDVRVKQHEEIIKEGMLNASSTVLAIWPSPMIYAGPTEVQWHAKSRRNAGASFFVVGRDPAGIKRSDNSEDFYAGEHGRYVLQMSPGLGNLGIMSFGNVYYDVKDQQMKPKDSSRPSDFLSISGSKMRKMAKNGAKPCNGAIPSTWKDDPSCVPDGFMSERGWKVVTDYYQNVNNPARVWIPWSREVPEPTLAKEGKFKEEGVFGQADYSLYFVDKAGTRLSPWHNISLHAADSPDLFNFIVEISKGTMAKMEINKETAHNPIKQDISKGKPRFYTYGVPFFNYGAFPQTWEDPNVKDSEGRGGDNDPLDVIELGSASLPMGTVVPVRVLGSLSLIDQGEVDTKVLVISQRDPLFSELRDIQDFQRKRPEVIPKVIAWLKKYKTSDGKPENVLAQEEPVGRAETLRIIQRNHEEWKALVERKVEAKDFFLP